MSADANTDTDVAAVPLCVDLDGTLTTVDTLQEALLRLLLTRPLRALAAIRQLREGRAQFKEAVARELIADATVLPYRPEVLAWLREEKAAGRRLVLVTGSNYRLAEAAAAHLDLFDELICSDATYNVSGDGKRARLVERFGERGFDYAGNDSVDLKVWPAARQAIVANAHPGVLREAQRIATVSRVFPRQPSLRAWFAALRPHQWIKNALVFAPLAAAHKLGDPALLAVASASFVAFSCAASSGYLVNDLLDVEADRRHPNKRRRPFAAGLLPVRRGLIAAGALLVPAFGIAALISLKLLALIVSYYALTLCYSLRLKRYALIDVMLLSGLYTMRILAGSAATDITPSIWLLAFSGFIFLSLGIVKRCSELGMMQRRGREHPHGRGYAPSDLPMLNSLAAASGYAAVTVLALYVDSIPAQMLYRYPRVLWLLCPLVLYWISRVLLLTHRGRMHDDPIVFAIKDRISIAIAAMVLVVATIAKG